MDPDENESSEFVIEAKEADFFSERRMSNLSDLSKVTCTKFPIFYVDNNSDDSIIHAVVLNYWDNICGPRIHSAWTVNRTSSVSKSGKEDCIDWDAVGFMGRQVLCGEIMKSPSDLFLETKFYDSPEKKIALAAVVFGAIDQGEMKAHSLCLIPNYDKLKQFLQWKDVCFQWLTKCVLQLRVTLANNTTAGYTIVKEDLRRLVEVMEQKIDMVHKTLFSELEDPLLFEFLHNSLIAFLCQGHQAVVVGTDIDQVNKMIKTLATFVLPHRLHRCSVLNSTSSQFAPEIHLQGLYKSEHQIKQLLADVLFCPQPTAYIDCDKKEVFIISWCEDYHDIRNKFLDEKLAQLWSECSAKELQFSNIFKPVKVSKSLIQEFLVELSLLHERLKKPFIHNFTKSLNRKFLLLMQCLENLRQNSKKVPQGFNQTDNEIVTSTIRNKFYVNTDWDIHIISSSPYNLPVNYF